MHEHVEYPEAYANGTKRRILWNARKTFERVAKHAVLVDIMNGGYEMGEDKDGHVIMSHPLGRVPAFVHKMQKSLDEYGKLSERQVQACYEAIANRQERDAEFKRMRSQEIKQKQGNSKFVGKEGEKMTLDLTCEHISEIQGPAFSHYDTGVQLWFTLADDQGNQYRYKGRSEFIQKGQKATVSFSVKRHYLDKNEIACTVIQRPKTIFIYL